MSPVAARPVRLILDFDPRSEGPSGTLTADSGATATFNGWVGLTRAIELALAERREDVPTDGAQA